MDVELGQFWPNPNGWAKSGPDKKEREKDMMGRD